MNGPGLPSGYDTTKRVHTSRRDCQVTVGFDRHRNHVPCFLVRLHYTPAFTPIRWTAIARFDHNETAAQGHDIFQQGIHVDVERKSDGEVKLHPTHPPLPPNPGAAIRRSVEYFIREADYFVDVYNGDRSPSNPPNWPDGGERTHSFNRLNVIGEDMSQESEAEDTVTLDELTEILADTTGTTAAEIERQADQIEMNRPWEADVVTE